MQRAQLPHLHRLVGLQSAFESVCVHPIDRTIVPSRVDIVRYPLLVSTIAENINRQRQLSAVPLPSTRVRPLHIA